MKKDQDSLAKQKKKDSINLSALSELLCLMEKNTAKDANQITEILCDFLLLVLCDWNRPTIFRGNFRQIKLHENCRRSLS